MARLLVPVNRSWRGSQRSLDTPSERVKPTVKGRDVNSRFLSPSSKTLSLAVEGKNSYVSTVACLFGRSGPSHIVWFIVAVIVNAINRVFYRRTFAHVRQEILKRLAPSLTDFDASSAVACIRNMLGIGTSGYHARPDKVFRRCIAWINAVAMFQRRLFLSQAILGVATTANSGFSTQGIRGGGVHITTRTLTKPVPSLDLEMMWPFGLLDNRESSKGLTDKTAAVVNFAFAHDPIITYQAVDVKEVSH